MSFSSHVKYAQVTIVRDDRLQRGIYFRACCNPRNIESAKIFLQGISQDYAKIKCRENKYHYGNPFQAIINRQYQLVATVRVPHCGPREL